MTLEQSTRLIWDAVEFQDLEALQVAAKARKFAIARLNLETPTPALRDAVAASVAAGEEAKRAIRSIRQRIRNESRRMANIEYGFLRGLVPAARHQVDCKG